MATEQPPPDSDPDPEPSDAEQPLGRDERVSAWPATFEQVVKAMLNTPPAEDGK